MRTLFPPFVAACFGLCFFCFTLKLQSAGSEAPVQTAVASAVDTTIAEGRKFVAAGDFVHAIERFTAAANSARQIGDLDRESAALRQNSMCNAALFHYREALQLAQDSRDLAIRAKDGTSAGAAAMILCSLYQLLGDLPLAEKESSYTVATFAASSRRDLLAKAWLSRATLDQYEGRGLEAIRAANRAISVAQQSGLSQIEGVAWDFSGILLVAANEIPDAEQALDKAVAIQTNLHDTDNIAVTHEHLAELELRKSNYAAALKFLDQAFAANTPAFTVNPKYYPVHLRAQILLGLGRTREALAEFRHAADLASEWRSGALPGDVTSTFTVARLHEVYEDYAELAATLALKNHDSALARDALETLASSRAANLREELTLSLSQGMRLPPEYFELISALQKEQAQVTFAGKPEVLHEAKLRELRVQLSDLENKLGFEELDNSPQKENYPHKNAIGYIQSKLGSGEVLLSFGLGKHRSFVWAVTRQTVNLYELPEERKIASQAKTFANATRFNQDISVSGAILSQTLFGQLAPDIWRKREWLLTPDGALLD